MELKSKLSALVCPWKLRYSSSAQLDSKYLVWIKKAD